MLSGSWGTARTTGALQPLRVLTPQETLPGSKSRSATSFYLLDRGVLSFAAGQSQGSALAVPAVLAKLDRRPHQCTHSTSFRKKIAELDLNGLPQIGDTSPPGLLLILLT
jgi:hypothetical protein